MFNLDTSIHIVGHVLIEICVEDLPYWWHLIYATSLIVPVFMRFWLSWLDSSRCQIFPAIMEILIHCISSIFTDIFIMEILIYVYCTWRWPHMSYCIMHIHGHCTLMYLGLLYVFADLYHCIVLIGWLVLPLGSSSLHFWDWLIMYFGHRMTPLTSHIRGHLL